MRRSRLAALAAVLLLTTPAAAAEDGPLVDFQVMEPDFAVEMAQSVLGKCREAGYQVAVAVVDRFGQPQAIIRDRFAGPHTVDTAVGKAWSAASFRERTLTLYQMIKDGDLHDSLRDVPGALMLGGGVPVTAAGSIIGAVGVSGAPGPDLDDACAEAGIAEMAHELEF